jgi:hypothetical protein
MSAPRIQDVTIARTTFHEVITVDAGTGTISLSGQESTPGLDNLTIDEAKARRRNLTALERGQIVPIIFEKQADLSGWFRIGHASSSTTEHGAVYLASWTLTAERILDPAAIAWALRTRRLHLSNVYATTSTAGAQLIAYPPGVNHILAAGGTQTTRASIDGSVVCVRSWTADTHEHRAFLDEVSDLYLAAAEIHQGGHLVEGLGLHGPDAGLDLVSVNNGIIRLSTIADATTNLLRLEAWSSADGWSTVAELSPSFTGTESFLVKAATVLRNTTEEVAIRLIVTDDGFPVVPVDITLRRGSLAATINVAASTGFTSGIRTTIAGLTDLDGARIATSATAEGHKLVIGAALFATASGGLDATTISTRLGCFAGVERSGAATPEQALAILADYIEQPILDAKPVAV